MKPCPVTTCNESRKDSQLACAWHWSRLPESLRRQIWTLYREAKGSPAHLSAVGAAMRLLRGMA